MRVFLAALVKYRLVYFRLEERLLSRIAASALAESGNNLLIECSLGGYNAKI